MAELGHRGVYFRDKSGAVGEFSLDRNLSGEVGIFLTGVIGEKRAMTLFAFELLRKGDEEGCLAWLRNIYDDEVTVEWVPADRSLLNIATRPRQFDILPADL